MTVPFPSSEDRLLPLLGDLREERSDAARNRRILLDAAAKIVAASGPAALTMDELARSAQVGKGTIFRRFGSRTGLLLALLDQSERRFQAALISGPPPLGPGASAVDRLVAFGRARIELFQMQGDVLVDAGVRFSGGAYWSMVSHVCWLLRQTNISGDVHVLAQFLIAALDPRLILQQVHEQSVSLARISDTWESIVRSVTNPHTAT